ncbi:hypothetical protein [Epilithonimonas caeni]|uniref:hypothetical protein n=1 Tax=Epilithonimonas caeni TaxID=365343 RepID=UPI0003FFE94C|nr:hypothetical protein [Epilithonimonas caeni]
MRKATFLSMILFLSATLLSCRKEIKSPKGGIDIISNVYFTASKSLDSMKSFHVSKLNYMGDSIIEFVPSLEIPEIITNKYFINDSVYFDINKGNEIENGMPLLPAMSKYQFARSVYNKRIGAIYTKEPLINYKNRKNLSDTILFGKEYQRFEIKSPWNYTRFYIYKTDTILPYSLYKNVENDYKGRLERIDSYNRKTDIFVSVQLIPRKILDKEAEDIFKFNLFANKIKK